MDVEGAEILVLKGLEPELANVNRIIYEVIKEDTCESFLKNHGFKIIAVFDFDNVKYKVAEKIRGYEHG